MNFHNEEQRTERNTALNEIEWASCLTGTANPGGNPFHGTSGCHKKEVPVFARKVGKKGGVIIFALKKIRFHNESSLTKDEDYHS